VLTPTVSVVMPTFNRLEHLRAAIASVHVQTFEDWELIVVDDGSDDATREHLRSVQHPRTTVVLEPHTGVPATARNRGIALARGRYIAFLDSDDCWAPSKLERQLELMRAAPARRWSYTAVRRIDDSGRALAPSRVAWVPYSGWILKHVLNVDAQIAMPTVMAEAAFVRELGGFDEQLRMIEDYDLWARMAMKSEVGVDDEPTADVRNHGEQLTLDRGGKLAGWAAFYAKMEALVPTEPLRALCRERRNEHVLLLAAEHARTRDWAALRRALGRAVRAHALSPRGWLRVAKATALSKRRGTVG
jgi:glycosyltransferase involved in cell wall biosynthesis